MIDGWERLRPAIFTNGPIFFDVTNPVYAGGAQGNGTTDDTAPILAAYAAARANPGGPGTVLFPPGQYLISSPIAGAYGLAGGSEPAVSLVAMSSAGHIGDVGWPTERGAVELIASPTFPTNQFLIDYTQSPVNHNGGTGAWIKGLCLSCQGRAIGMRLMGIRRFNVEDISINNAGTPVSGTSDGAFVITTDGVNPTAGAWNTITNLSIEGAQHSGIYHNAPNEDVFYNVFVQNCDGDNGNHGGIRLDSGAICNFQGGTITLGNLGWDIVGWVGTVVGVRTETNGVKRNGLRSHGQSTTTTAPQTQRFVACVFANNPAGGDTEANSAIIRCLNDAPGRPQLLQLFSCEFIGNGTTTSDYVIVEAGTQGTVQLDNCQFHGGVITNKFNDLSGNAVLRMHNNVGINPVGTLVVPVPATGVATAAQAVDAEFFVAAAAGGSCTITVQGGPTITVAANGVESFYVPAGQTVTPTFGVGNAPTWQVNGL